MIVRGVHYPACLSLDHYCKSHTLDLDFHNMSAFRIDIKLFNSDTGEIYHDVSKVVTSEEVLYAMFKRWSVSFSRALSSPKYRHPQIKIEAHPVEIYKERFLNFKEGCLNVH